MGIDERDANSMPMMEKSKHSLLCEPRSMDIDQLSHFLKVAEHQNFTKAAEEVGLSQPAISRSLQRLEEEMGQPLLDRQNRKVILTEAGERLLSKAKNILSLVSDAKNELIDDGKSGTIRLGAIPTIAPYFLPSILRSFATKFPQARMVVQENTTQVLIQRLHHGEIDLAILAHPIPEKYLEVESLFDEELFLVAAKGHPLTEKAVIRMTDLREYPFVLLEEAHCLSDSIVSLCRSRSFQPISVERTSQLVTIQELVALHHGISFIPAMAKELDHSPRRIYRSVGSPKPTRTVIMAWNPYRYESQLHKKFRRFLSERKSNSDRA